LRGQADNTGAVLVVGGDATSLGGYFHWRPERDAVIAISADLPASEWAAALGRCSYVVAVREPLGAAAMDSVELVAAFRGTRDLRASDRRFVYRVRR
jgi:hypothetical protein